MEKLKISAVTTSYNQGNFIEETIQSVLNQNYSNCEHIVVDGGSSDNTLDILKMHKHLRWISEKDRGQSDALNKGLKMAGGDVIAWINSDDTYVDNVFRFVSEYFLKNPDHSVIFGEFKIIDEKSTVVKVVKCYQFTRKQLLSKGHSLVGQPSVFFRRSVLDTIGYIDEDIHVGMDYDFFIRMNKEYEFFYIPKVFANFRIHNNSKTIDRIKEDIKNGYAISKMHGGGKYVSLHIYIILRNIYYLFPSVGHLINRIRYRLKK